MLPRAPISPCSFRGIESPGAQPVTIAATRGGHREVREQIEQREGRTGGCQRVGRQRAGREQHRTRERHPRVHDDAFQERAHARSKALRQRVRGERAHGNRERVVEQLAIGAAATACESARARPANSAVSSGWIRFAVGTPRRRIASGVASNSTNTSTPLLTAR
jgi:hypothetical protein